MTAELKEQGGHGAMADADPTSFIDRLSLNRAPGQTIDPAQFVRWLWEFKHPRWVSIGVESNRWGNRPRSEFGLTSAGTVWVSDFGEREYSAVKPPCDCIPYTSIVSAEWSETQNRWVGGVLAKGWRSSLELLLAEGFLGPSRKLSWLIGKDSRLINKVRSPYPL